MHLKNTIIKRIAVNFLGENDYHNAVNAIFKLRSKIRKSHSFLKYFYIRKYNKICNRYGSFIPYSTQIGENAFFPHGLCGVFISAGAVIGNNCTIFHQVTIGSNTLKDSLGYGAPVIGDNVYFGAGCKVIGNVHVGDNVRIGANAVVTSDVPDNATVVAEKSRIILHEKIRPNEFEEYI